MVKKKNSKYFRNYFLAFPVAIPMTIAIFSVVCVSFLLVGRLRLIYVIPVGLSLSFFTYHFVSSRYAKIDHGNDKRAVLYALLLMSFVSGWFLFNIKYTSENVFVNRDPGIYTVAGAWLVENEGIEIPTQQVFDRVKGASSDSSAFPTDAGNNSEINVQGQHLLPSLLGIIGKLSSYRIMLFTGPFFGVTAIITLFGLTRIFTSSKWALVASIIFGLSLPLIYFSRDTYTEPLTATLALGSLSMFWLAINTRRSPLVWLLTGVITGSGALVRADGYIVPIVILGFLFLYYVSRYGNNKSISKNAIIMFLVGLLPVLLLGWLDITVLSSGYYQDVGDEIRAQIKLLGITLIFGLLSLIFLNNKLFIYFRKYIIKHQKKIAVIAASSLVLIFIVLVSRPLWFVSYDYNQPAPISSYIGGLQAREGVEVNINRNYAENTANWITWYVGIFTSVLAVVGASIATYQSIKKRGNILLLPAILLIVGTTILFMVKVGITPDHVWASRRFLPITFPGIAFMAVYALYIFEKNSKFNKNATHCLLIVAVLLSILGPLSASKPFANVSTYDGQLKQVQAMCDMMPDNSAVLWVGPAGWNSIQTVRSFCGFPAMRIEKLTAIDIKNVVDSAKEKGYKPVVVIRSYDQGYLPDTQTKGLSIVPVDVSYKVIPSQLLSLPKTSVTVDDNAILLGTIDNSGNITELLP